MSEEGDTKALIERLRAEIAFLREQLRNSNSSDSSERVRKIAPDRPERSNEREMELQNHLLDLQENYSALSQRHAKLISELTKASESEVPAASDYNQSAEERVKRSNSFAVAVEQVVLEYEKTIQSLESSLQNTRSSLSTTESFLLEKENKLAYIETVNQQLQTRLQKMMDRESATETYLHDLEAKLMGHTSGEEKNAAVISELRKEIARIRENEAGAEDYISTLEERLAEADQDLELMTREISRLEHIVERQRNLGKIESVLAEFAVPDGDAKTTNGVKMEDEEDKENAPPKVNGHSQNDTGKVNGYHGTIEEDDVGAALAKENHTPTVRERRASKPGSHLPEVTINSGGLATETQTHPPQSPAQTEFVHDKLENVQQELLELRVEHESTLNEFEQMSTNYDVALRELARLQDEVDELHRGKQMDTPRTSSPPPSPSPMRPVSFLAGTRVSELKSGSSSVSLSSELSLAVDSPSPTPDVTEADPDQAQSGNTLREELEVLRTLHQEHQEKEEALAAEMENIKKEHMEKQARIAELQKERVRIQQEHKEALELLEELKQDVAKARTQTIAASSAASHLIRRKSSQSLTMLDRAQRSFTSLRKIAEPYLETHPECLENFDSNMEEALHELHMRSERIQELENEITALRRDLENKSTMITGLTRERSSKSSSPMDISVVAVMERRIEEAESEAKCLRRQVTEREDEYNRELHSLREQLLASVNEAKGLVTALLEAQKKLSESGAINEHQARKIDQLQSDFDAATREHSSTINAMKDHEKSLLDMIGELEAAMRQLEEARVNTANNTSAELERKAKEFEEERVKQQGVVSSLQQTIDDHKAKIDLYQQAIDEHSATIDHHLQKIAELEETSAATRLHLEEQLALNQEQLKEKLAEAEETQKNEVKKHRDTLSQISNEVSEKIKMIEDYESQLSALQSSLDDALSQVAQLKESEGAAQSALTESEARVAELIAAAEARAAAEEAARISHEAELATQKDCYEQRLASTREILDESNKAAESQTRRLDILQKSLLDAQNTIDALERNRDMVAEAHMDNSETTAEMATELAQAKKQIQVQVETIKELKELHEKALAEVEKLTKKEAKHARVIDDLEQQLAFTFDQNQETAQRLASVTAEYEQVRAEREALVAEAAKRGNDVKMATETLNEEISSLKVCIKCPFGRILLQLANFH